MGVMLASLAPAFAVTTQQNPFQDVPVGTWYYPNVCTMYQTGLMAGMTEDTFDPSRNMTREMAVAVLYRLAGYIGCDTTCTGTADYTDCNPKAYYADALAWCTESEVVAGYPDGSFGVGQPVTREQFCAFVIRFLRDCLHYDLSAYAQAPSFADADKISDYAVADVGIAEKLGIIYGRAVGLVVPQGTTTRAEAAAFFSRVLTTVRDLAHDYATEITFGAGETPDAIRVTDGGELAYEWEGDLSGIPVLRLEGDVTGVSKENPVLVTASYAGGDMTFDCFATIKWQGNTSLQYEKKNYNIKLFKDAEQSSKNKVDLGWGKESKYCLKANYIDFSQARNVVSAKLWGEVVKSREHCNPNLMELCNGGAVDGYPVMLFLNGVYQGLYTLNMPKDEWIWDSGIDDLQAAVVSDIASAATLFRGTTTLESGEWEVEYAVDDNEQAAIDSLNQMLAFVSENDGAAFVEGVDQYLDVDAAIDYMLCAYYMNLPDNYARNMVLLTYDGVQWIPSMYDLDASWGLHWGGETYYPADMMLPTVEADGSLTSGATLLWDRLLQNYPERVKARYAELRATILNETHVMAQFEVFQAKIPPVLFETETFIYPAAPSMDTNNLTQIRAFQQEHVTLLDQRMGYSTEIKTE